MNIASLATSKGTLVLVSASLAAVATFLAMSLSEIGADADPDQPLAGPADNAGAVEDHTSPVDYYETESVGPSQAASNLTSAVAKTPFEVRLPAYTPPGLELQRFNLMVVGKEQAEASLDAYYTRVSPPDQPFRPALHVWQTNRAYESGDPLQPPADAGTITAAGQSWRYWLLIYPQPGGGNLNLYAAETTDSDGVSISIDIRVGMDPDKSTLQSSLDELTRVIESLATHAR